MSRQTFRGPHKPHTGCVKSLAATGHSATQWWLGDPNNGSFQIMNGISFQDKDILKARRKSKKWYVPYTQSKDVDVFLGMTRTGAMKNTTTESH